MKSSSLDDRRQWVLAALREYELPLLRFVGRLLGREDSAGDVVQFAFLRLCEQSPEDLHDRVAPWLYTVCRNKAVDLMRQRGRIEPMPEGEEPTCDRQSDPAEIAERQEVYQRLIGLIDRLPPAQREVIALWSEGFTYREIATMLQRTEGNVRVLIHRAIKRLREHPTCRQLIESESETQRTV